MYPSTFDPFLFYSSNDGKNQISILGLQIGDILFLANEAFVDKEELEHRRENLIVQDRQKFTKIDFLKFNG